MSLEINGLQTNQAGSNKAKASGQVTKSSGESGDTTKAPSANAEGTVVLSAEAKSLSKLTGGVSTEPPIDQAKIDAIKAAIYDGSFKLNAESVAGKLIDSDDLF
ncbi:flagellar biosynthesis anti-sigma factor FlgM [Gammaproteobacteria bacterium 45_16_T64]|mgnify:CR=1 FL=1|nr:flagellar biosynthesis anti-sigma factor FlgM [Gammaproteobacteria bacterium 45_16_T64]